MMGWFEGHEALLGWLGVISLLMFFGSLIAVPMVIVWLPKDFLRQEIKRVKNWPRYVSVPFYIVKNSLGIVFILTGLAMLILPGQGLLTLFIGVALINFPRKRVFIRKVVGQRRIFRAINRLRERFGKPKFELP